MHIKMSHRVPQTVVPWLGFSWIAPRVLCDPAKRCLPLSTHHHPTEFTACWDCYCSPPLPILFQQSAWHWSSRQELVKTKKKKQTKALRHSRVRQSSHRQIQQGGASSSCCNRAGQLGDILCMRITSSMAQKALPKMTGLWFQIS